MNKEEQHRQSPETEIQKSQVKNRILTIAMLFIASGCAVFGYMQHLEAKANRGEVIKLHREIKRLKEESEAVRIEASKLRTMIEVERKNAEAALKEVQSK